MFLNYVISHHTISILQSNFFFKSSIETCLNRELRYVCLQRRGHHPSCCFKGKEEGETQLRAAPFEKEVERDDWENLRMALGGEGAAANALLMFRGRVLGVGSSHAARRGAQVRADIAGAVVHYVATLAALRTVPMAATPPGTVAQQDEVSK